MSLQFIAQASHRLSGRGCGYVSKVIQGVAVKCPSFTTVNGILMILKMGLFASGNPVGGGGLIENRARVLWAGHFGGARIRNYCILALMSPKRP